MTNKVLLVPMGTSKEQIVKIFRKYGYFNKVYFFVSEGSKQYAEEVIATLQSQIGDYKIVDVNAFKARDCMEKYAEAYLAEANESEIYISVTSGTNPMVGAAYVLASILGLKALYSKHSEKKGVDPKDIDYEKEIIEMELPPLSRLRSVPKRKLEVLAIIVEKGEVGGLMELGTALKKASGDKLSSSVVLEHVNELEKWGLVEIERSKPLKIRPTAYGKIYTKLDVLAPALKRKLEKLEEVKESKSVRVVKK